MIEKMKALHMVTFTLLIAGGVDLALTALGFDVVAMILGVVPGLEQIFDIAVGISAVVVGATHMQDCKMCAKKK